MKTKITLLLLTLAMLTTSLAVGDVKSILEKTPAGNPAAIGANAAGLVKIGPSAVRELCAMLAEPGDVDDSKVRYALDGMAVYVSRPGAEGERKMFVGAVIESLDKAKGKEVKRFLIERLQRVGKAESVDAISGYLSDERLCEPASQALQAIACDKAIAALVKALGRAKGNNLVTIISALGNVKCKAAAKDLLKFTASKNTNTRMAALHAIANIGDPSAGSVLAKAAQAKGSYERAKATSYYLLYARRLAEDGNKHQCAAICRDLIKTGTEHVQCAALSTLVSTEGEKALSDLLTAADSDSIKVQAAALALANNIDGQAITNKLIDKMNASQGATKAQIIGMLGERGDKAAMYRIIGAFKDGDKDVRTAAIAAAVKLGGDAAVMSMLEFMKSSTAPDEIQFAARTVSRVKGDTVLRAMAKILPTMNTQAKVAIIGALAARKAKAQSEAIFAQVDSSDSAVRSAAIKSLVDVGTPKDMDKLIGILNTTTGGADHTAAQRTIVAVAEQIEDPQRRAGKVLAAMQKAEGSKRIALIQVLGRIGGGAAMKAVVKETATGNKAVIDAAVRALTSWPSGEATGALLNIIKRTDNVTHRVLALRGMVRLLTTSGADQAQAIEMYRQALRTVERPDEKKLIIAGLGSIRSIESLRLVAGYLDDDALKSEAALAAVKIACAQKRGEKGLSQYESVVILRRAIGAVSDARLRQQAEKHIKSIAPTKTAEIKPVPEGFVALFNGKDLTGWKALLHRPNDNPIKRATLTPEKHAELQAKEDESMRQSWKVEAGVLHFDGKGFSLATARKYGDFEMLVDWRIVNPHGDSGIYLRGAPQVQIWDPEQWKIGSGGLYNNKKNPSKPTKIADNPIGAWNTFRIIMIGEKVTVYLNGELVVDNVVLENYWDRSRPIFATEQIELQCHGNPIDFTNIFIREIPRAGEFRPLFNGRDLAGWIGDTKGYIVEDGAIVCKPGGNLYTAEQFDNFHFKFDFKLTTNANNGLGIRTPSHGDAAYAGMELQILDNTGSAYTKLQPYQYHGSIYGIVPAKRGFLKPVGEWNHQEVIAKGPKIKVILNGTTIVDADIEEAVKNYAPGKMHDPKRHPGLKNKEGHIGFLGHGSVVYFKNIEIMDID
ncbi:MAG: DUF1080 domain-containing protein [Planctomycetes bacterium]|nr:DUF1080 domain-containing protein [Planctomycetota bacterium]